MRERKTRKLRRDFYMEMNGDWKRATVLPDTETRITQAYFIQKEINKELDAIIRVQEGPMADLVRSWRAAEGRIPNGLTALINTMMAIESASDIVARIGWMNRYRFSAPLCIYVQGDEYNQRLCRVFIEEGEPNIGIPEYWLYPEYTSHRRAYAGYVKELASILGLPALLKGYECEREFAKVYPNTMERRKRIKRYTFAELCKEYHRIDWTALLTASGLPQKKLHHLEYNVTSDAFLHHLQMRICSWTLDRWRGWFALMITQLIAGCSPHGPLRTAWFKYTRQFLQGAKKSETPEELRTAIVSMLMPNALGHLWVTKHCDRGLKRTITMMIEHIRDAAIDQLHTTQWMSESTRAAAVRKLRRMDVQICWPDKDQWKPYEVNCCLSSTDLIHNIITIGKINTDKNQEMLTTGDCRHPYGDGWGKPVYVVNAYYYPDENRFLLPAAILREPFYDSAKSAAWNYGAIGATIGHEFCHAFDADGRQYDENGNKRDWWTARDDRAYKKLAGRVVRLYESEQFRGKDVYGKLTLVENIADIGGTGFALGGLQRALGRPLSKAELRDFFTSFAVSWRAKDRLKRATELLATDPHSPPMLRVNHVVRQMDDWYTAFDVGPGDHGWVSPDKRIRFFGTGHI